jgi:PHD/YefM family antitoxin component YafN of YafNO toxin-antitoxin module
MMSRRSACAPEYALKSLTVAPKFRNLLLFRILGKNAMVAITATEFAKNFGRYKEAAQREPIAITSYGRTSGYFVSAQEYAELQRLRALERRAYRLSELPAEVADAIEVSKMNPAHDHLNDLLKEPK